VDKAYASFHAESFHPVPPTPGISLLFPFPRKQADFTHFAWTQLKQSDAACCSYASQPFLIAV